MRFHFRLEPVDARGPYPFELSARMLGTSRHRFDLFTFDALCVVDRAEAVWVVDRVEAVWVVDRADAAWVVDRAEAV